VTRRLAGAATAALAIAIALLVAGEACASGSVRSLAVTFTVQNTNRSLFGCASDGAAYEVRGHLIAPGSALAKSAARRGGATLYLHGLNYGEWLWNFTAVPGHDYAVAQAKAGHVSVVVDRVGYGASGHPDGNATCLGAAADMAHQIVSALRSGAYAADGAPGPRFKRIALVGHNIGGEIANIEAASFKDVDALGIVSYSFQNLPRASVEFGLGRLVCQSGGESAFPGGPGGYTLQSPTAAGFKAVQFHSASAAVQDAAARLHNPDPCGDGATLIPALVIQKKTVAPKIKVPVMVICGKRDVLYAPLGCEVQRDRYIHSRDRSLALVPNAGQGITLERSAPVFRAKLGRWLAKHGF
jgi:pimeloyl-ACP methyl ester carboxylesterase